MKIPLCLIASLAVAFSVHAGAPESPAAQVSPALSRLHFLCSGIRPISPNFKLEEGIVCFNPSPREVTTTWTFYTADAEPAVVTLQLPPNRRKWGRGLPKDAWGVKIESSEPIAVQGFVEHFYSPYNDDFTLTPEFARAYNQYSQLSVPALGRAFYLPDVTSSPSPEKLKTVEKQWFTVCNPNKTDAKVKFTDNFISGGEESREITVPAERIKHFEMTEIGLKEFEGGVIIIESDLPIAVQQARTVEGTPNGKFNQLRFSVFTFMLPGGPAEPAVAGE